MFNKLSFAEKSAFYGAVAELERHYSKGKILEGMEAMSAILDAKANGETFDGSEQIELLPFEPQDPGEPEGVKKTRIVLKRRSNGENYRTVEKYVKERWPNLTVEEAVLWLYYGDNIKQRTIGDMLGVNQRAISKIIQDIPEQKKRQIMSRWSKR